MLDKISAFMKFNKFLCNESFIEILSQVEDLFDVSADYSLS